MIINYIAIFVALIIGLLLIKELVRTLKKYGHNDIADSVEELGQHIKAKTDGLVDEGKKSISEILNPQRLDFFIAEQINRISGNTASFLKKRPGQNAFVITEDSEHPFQITDEIAQKTDQLIIKLSGTEEKAIAIFDWFQKNFPYDQEQYRKIKEKTHVTYRHSKEVWHDRTGVCGELTILLIVMFRYAGIMANFVDVTVDEKGAAVAHACVFAKLGRRNVYPDPAYHNFNAKHRKTKIISDTEALNCFKAMR